MDGTPNHKSPAGQQPPARFTFRTTAEIMAAKDPAPGWIVPDFLSEGLTLLAGRPQTGKSWLALDWAIAVAGGARAFKDIACEKGDVVFFDFENGERRLRQRIRKWALAPDDGAVNGLERLRFVRDAPPLGAGFLEALEDWRSSVQNPRLVVIDELSRILPAGRRAAENALSALRRWADENRLAVLALHHGGKGGSLSALADATLTLRFGHLGLSLHAQGRDFEACETLLSFDGATWTVLGDASGNAPASAARELILKFMKDCPGPVTASELAALLERKHDNTRQMLFKMARDGQLVRKSGRYRLPGDDDDNSGNGDNGRAAGRSSRGKATGTADEPKTTIFEAFHMPKGMKNDDPRLTPRKDDGETISGEERENRLYAAGWRLKSESRSKPVESVTDDRQPWSVHRDYHMPDFAGAEKSPAKPKQAQPARADNSDNTGNSDNTKVAAPGNRTEASGSGNEPKPAAPAKADNSDNTGNSDNTKVATPANRAEETSPEMPRPATPVKPDSTDNSDARRADVSSTGAAGRRPSVSDNTGNSDNAKAAAPANRTGATGAGGEPRIVVKRTFHQTGPVNYPQTAPASSDEGDGSVEEQEKRLYAAGWRVSSVSKSPIIESLVSGERPTIHIFRSYDISLPWGQQSLARVK